MKSRFIGNIKIGAGLILLILNTGIWINGLFIHRDSGMDTVLALPLLVIGAFLLLGWYKTSGSPNSSKRQRRKFILSVFLINYGVLYILYMLADIIYSPSIDFLTMPGIILPLLLGIFVMGFILSWNYELYAGIFFLVWYCLVLYSSLKYFEILNRGPHILFGITILIHGILYITYHFRLKSRSVIP
jgi:hypothetical protein